MAAWSGWVSDVLTAGGWPLSAANQRFLNEWHGYEQSACANNPLNTTLPRFNGINCVDAGGGAFVQSYPTRLAGTRATVSTLRGLAYTAITAALAAGDPYNAAAAPQIVRALETWGSGTFAAAYAKQTGATAQPGPTRGSPADQVGAVTASGHRGYADLRYSVAQHLPAALQASRVAGAATLRVLGARSKVGH